jgi:hypothetical protein
MWSMISFLKWDEDRGVRKIAHHGEHRVSQGNATVRIVSWSGVQEPLLFSFAASSWLMCGFGLGFFEDLMLLMCCFLMEVENLSLRTGLHFPGASRLV